MSKIRSGLTEHEARWERAFSPGLLEALNGEWRVERLSGPLPMPLVRKRIRDGRGTTFVSPLGPGMPFRLEQRGGHVALVYGPPLSFLIDELRREADGSWLGRATVVGIRYAWFRMVPARGAGDRRRGPGR